MGTNNENGTDKEKDASVNMETEARNLMNMVHERREKFREVAKAEETNRETSKPDRTTAEGKWTCLMEMVDKCHNILGLSIESTLNGDKVMVLHPRIDRPTYGQTVILPIGWGWVHAVHVDMDTQSIEFRLGGPEGCEDGPTFKHKVFFAPFTGETRDALVLRMRKVARLCMLPGGKVRAEETHPVESKMHQAIAESKEMGEKIKEVAVEVKEPKAPAIDSPLGWVETGVLNELGKLLENKASAADVLALLQPGLRKPSHDHDCNLQASDVCLFPAHGLAVHVSYHGGAGTNLAYLTVRKIERYCNVAHFEDGPAHVHWGVDGYMTGYTWCKYDKMHRIGKPAMVKLDKMGKAIEQWWHVEGQLHREDGPAHLIDRDPMDPTLPKGAPHYVARYFLNDQPRVDDCLVAENHKFLMDGLDVPDATKKTMIKNIYLRANGNKITMTYLAYPNRIGQLHSFCGCPAVVYTDKNGHILKQVWYKEGKVHREDDLPAVIEWSKKNPRCPLVQKWYLDGQLHRDDHGQPAVTAMDEDGMVVKEVWAKNGKLHRQGKPAVIVMKQNGKYRQAYYTEGKLVKEMGDCSEEKEPEEL